MKNVVIYGLIDPRTNELRYVGKTQDLRKRYYGHIYAKDGYRTRSAKWIISLKTQGILPEVFVIEEVNNDTWKEAEQFWIAYFKFLGCRLTNHTLGGEGGIGYKHTKETRLKLSLKAKGRKLTPEASKKLHKAAGDARRGSKNTLEHRRKISESKKGKKVSPKRREELIDQLKDVQRYKFTQEDRNKAKEVLKAKLTGVPKVESHISNMKIAALERWAKVKGK